MTQSPLEAGRRKELKMPPQVLSLHSLNLDQVDQSSSKKSNDLRFQWKGVWVSVRSERKGLSQAPSGVSALSPAQAIPDSSF